MKLSSDVSMNGLWIVAPAQRTAPCSIPLSAAAVNTSGFTCSSEVSPTTVQIFNPSDLASAVNLSKPSGAISTAITAYPARATNLLTAAPIPPPPPVTTTVPSEHLASPEDGMLQTSQVTDRKKSTECRISRSFGLFPIQVWNVIWAHHTAKTDVFICLETGVHIGGTVIVPCLFEFKLGATNVSQVNKRDLSHTAVCANDRR